MTYSPDYTIELNDGSKIDMLFVNKAFRLYSEKKGIKTREKIIDSITDFNVFELWLACHECYCNYNNIPFKVTEQEAESWIDRKVNFDANEFIKKLTIKLYGLTEEQYNELLSIGTEEEKKKVTS